MTSCPGSRTFQACPSTSLNFPFPSWKMGVRLSLAQDVLRDSAQHKLGYCHFDGVAIILISSGKEENYLQG